MNGLSALEDELGFNAPKWHVAIEPCREAWHVHDELVRCGHEVKLVDTTRVKKLGIGQHGRKMDRIDAEVLARALESGHIPQRRRCCRRHRRALRTPGGSVMELALSLDDHRAPSAIQAQSPAQNHRTRVARAQAVW